MEEPVSPLETLAPNYSRKTANLNYLSELTGEFGVIIVRPGTTEDDILTQYGQKFPRECALMINTIAELSGSLNRSNGMSKEGIIMALAKIPEVVFLAMRFLDPEYWEKPNAMLRFVRKYPRFGMGDHSRKTTRGIIIK